MKIKIKRFDKSFPLPVYQDGAAGFDFTCRETVTIEPGKMKAVAQNIVFKVPKDYVLLLLSRSSTAARKGVILANSVGVIDPFYCGDKDEILAFLLNITDKPVTIEAGDRIVQGLLVKAEPVSWNEVSEMKDEGHGGYRHGPKAD